MAAVAPVFRPGQLGVQMHEARTRDMRLGIAAASGVGVHQVVTAIDHETAVDRFREFVGGDQCVPGHGADSGSAIGDRGPIILPSLFRCQKP